MTSLKHFSVNLSVFIRCCNPCFSDFKIFKFFFSGSHEYDTDASMNLKKDTRYELNNSDYKTKVKSICSDGISLKTVKEPEIIPSFNFLTTHL